MENPGQFSGPDFEDRLGNDASGAFRAAVLRKLAQLRESCAAARRQPQDREAFRKLKAMSSAVDAAVSAVELMQMNGADGNRKSPLVTHFGS